MSVYLKMSLDQLVELVEQLSVEEKQVLISRMQLTNPPLTAEERIALLRSIVIDIPISPEFSFDPKDWYDDDHRAGLS